MKKLLILVCLFFGVLGGFQANKLSRELPTNINASHFLHSGLIIIENEKVEIVPQNYIIFKGELELSHYQNCTSLSEIGKIVCSYYERPQTELIKNVTIDTIKNNDLISKVIYSIGDQIIGVSEVVLEKELDQLNAPKLVGPTNITFKTNDYKNISDITSQFYFHNYDGVEPLDSKISVKLGNSWHTVKDINNMSCGNFEAKVEKRLLCGTTLSASFQLLKVNKQVVEENYTQANNNILVNLDNSRPTINEVIRMYTKQLASRGQNITDVSLLFTNYDRFDNSAQDSYAIVSYPSGTGTETRDRIYIAKSAITQNSTLKYNLITTFTILGTILLSIIIIVIRHAIVVKKIKKGFIKNKTPNKKINNL